jgi:hypothetical protein
MPSIARSTMRTDKGQPLSPHEIERILAAMRGGLTVLIGIAGRCFSEYRCEDGVWREDWFDEGHADQRTHTELEIRAAMMADPDSWREAITRARR